jgi:hypothetical protein
VLRGGAFNNNRQNVRAAYRNHNDPANRNNNIGFRVSCELSHIFFPLPGGWALVHPGLFAAKAAGDLQEYPPIKVCGLSEGEEMARVSPVRTGTACRAHSKKGRPLALPGPPPLFSALQPATQQTPNLRHHATDMLILPVTQPLPVVGQAQVEPQLVQGGIRRSQMALTSGATLTVGLVEALMKIEGGVHHSLRQRVAVDLGKMP